MRVVSRVVLAPETWLRDTAYMCTVYAQRVVKGFIMTAILPFAFKVGCECFYGQAQMHICVHLHTNTGTRVQVRVQVCTCITCCL